mgnify:CR=1 FL=1
MKNLSGAVPPVSDSALVLRALPPSASRFVWCSTLSSTSRFGEYEIYCIRYECYRKRVRSLFSIIYDCQRPVDTIPRICVGVKRSLAACLPGNLQPSLAPHKKVGPISIRQLLHCIYTIYTCKNYQLELCRSILPQTTVFSSLLAQAANDTSSAMKRKAPDEDAGLGPAKRQQTEDQQHSEFTAILLPASRPSSTSAACTPALAREEATVLPLSTPASADSATSTPPADQDDNETVISSIHPACEPPTPASTVPASTITGTTAKRTRRFPSDLKTIPCTYPNCPKTFNRPARLAAHLRSHTNDRPFACPYEGCTKTYLEEKHLTQHIKGSHTHERKYVCQVPNCGKAFVTATRLRRHAAVHEGQERFRCRGYEGCSASFRKHQTLARHIRVAHLGLQPFVCGVEGCEAGFDSAGALRRHTDREHGEIKFWCEECGKDEGEDGEGGGGRRVGFRTLLQLQAHMRKEHVNCVFCDVRCSSQAELERHIDMYHSGTTVEDRKTVACTWEGCNKKFTRVSNLNVHVRTAHQGVRFVCGQVDTFTTPDITDWNWKEEGCGQAFSSRLKLEEHVRYVHLGRKRPPATYTIKSARPGETDEMSAAVPTRTIACSVDGCVARFVRHHDLERHLEAVHFSQLELGGQEEAVMMPDGADGVGQPAQETTIDPRLQGLQGGDAAAVASNEPFWIESATPADDQAGFDNEWAEMRRLIDLDALMDARSE